MFKKLPNFLLVAVVMLVALLPGRANSILADSPTVVAPPCNFMSSIDQVNAGRTHWGAFNGTAVDIGGYGGTPVTDNGVPIPTQRCSGGEIYASISGAISYGSETFLCGELGTVTQGIMRVTNSSGVSVEYRHQEDNYPIPSGSFVQAGETIGTIGSVGCSTFRHIHFTVHKNGVTQTYPNWVFGDAQMPNVSINGVQFQNRVYYSTIQPDGAIAIRYYDNSTNQWSSAWDTSLGGAGTAQGTPNLTVFGNKLFLGVRGRDNMIYYNVMDSQYSWRGWRNELGGTIISNISTTVAYGKLYLLVVTTDGRARLNSIFDFNLSLPVSQSQPWLGFQDLENTSLGFIGDPAIVAKDNFLVISGRGANKHVLTRKYSISWFKDVKASPFGNWVDAGNASPVIADINLTNFKGSVYQFFVHEDKYLRFRRSTDGVNWSGYTTVGGTVDTKVATLAIQDKLFIAFKGNTDSMLYSTIFTETQAYLGGWVNHGGPIKDLPAFNVNYSKNTVDIKLIGTDNVYRYRSYNLNLPNSTAATNWGAFQTM